MRTIECCEKIEATIDSGAACCVYPQDLRNDVPIRLCAVGIKRKTEPERFVWDVLNAVVGAPWKLAPRAQCGGDEVPAAMSPMTECGGEQPLPVQPEVRSCLGGVDPRKVYIRAGAVSEKEHSEESQHKVQGRNHFRNVA